MTPPQTGPHAHDDFPIPTEATQKFARIGEVDRDLLSKLVTAAMDSCRDCQIPLLDRICQLPATIGQLVEIACKLVDDKFGGLPRNMIDPDASGVSSAEFRRVVAAGTDNQEQGVIDAIAGLASHERQRVAEDALEIVVGMLSVKRIGTHQPGTRG